MGWLARRRVIVMLGPSLTSMGGISSVVSVYSLAGLYSRWPILYLETHRDVPPLQRLLLGVAAGFHLIGMAMFNRVQGVHVHVAPRTSFWRKSVYMQVARLFRVPYIFHLHGGDFEDFYTKECGQVARLYIRTCLERSARVIVLAERWKHWIVGIAPGANVACVYNPVTVPRLAVTDVGARRPNLLYLGRLSEAKGVIDLIRAFARVHRSNNDVRLFCAGDGDQDAYRREAADQGVSSAVSFVGWVSSGEREQLLEAAAALVLPSYFEGLPMAILEAMAAGVPVVATQVGGIPEAIEDGSEGFLIQPGDVAGLGNALQRLIESPDLRRRMGSNARRKAVAKFSDDKIVDQLSALYADLGFST